MIASKVQPKQDRFWPAVWVVAATIVVVALPATITLEVLTAVALLTVWELKNLIPDTGRISNLIIGEAILVLSWPWWLLLIDLMAGRNAMAFVFIVIYVDDVCALLGGRQYGRHKLAPNISPGKTWEGSCFGLVGGVVAATVLGLCLHFHRPLIVLTGVAVILVVAGAVGDLAESLMKRRADVKDSGTILHGHGGLLDRLDALLWATPVAALMVAVHWL